MEIDNNCKGIYRREENHTGTMYSLLRRFKKNHVGNLYKQDLGVVVKYYLEDVRDTGGV